MATPREGFASSADYLSYLQGLYTIDYTDAAAADAEFHRLTNEERSSPDTPAIPPGPLGGIEWVIKQYYLEICASLKSATLRRIEGRIAAGAVLNGGPIAFIARSPDKKFAILFSSGLALFLHKYIKFNCASINPRNVVYCNRADAKLLTRANYREYIDEFIAYYTDTGIPKGPMIKLDKEGSARSSTLLRMAEIFILCHELAHFLNGDLEEEGDFAALPNGVVGQRYVENKSYSREHRADVVGFDLYRDAIGYKGPAVHLLNPLVLLFDLFYQMGHGESSSHPHPYARIERIVSEHFDPKKAAELREALANPQSFPAFYGR